LDNIIARIVDKVKDFDVDGSETIISFLTEIDALDFRNLTFNLFQNNTTYSWSKPFENTRFITKGVLFSIQENGKDRLINSQITLNEKQFRHVNNFDEFDICGIPLFLGGLKFSPETGKEPWQEFADSHWFIPETLFIAKNDRFYICENFTRAGFNSEVLKSRIANSTLVSEIARPEIREDVHFFNISPDDKNHWENLVNTALGEISAGEYSKIVLSRRVELTTDDNVDIAEWLETLESRYPLCYTFAFRNGNSIFFGATPEKLAVIHENIIEADALAGSIPRGINEFDDDKLANDLLLDKKNCSEHRAVVDFIVESFTAFADNVVYPEKPVIKKLKNIQHLWTPIKGVFKGDSEIFLMLKSLHPTPAICGTPWRKALKGIVEKEAFNRGFFTGVVGWFNFEKEGEFAVGIRSALLKNKTLYGFAGCGIVDGSDPHEEYRETELKLKPILNLADYEKVSES